MSQPAGRDARPPVDFILFACGTSLAVPTRPRRHTMRKFIAIGAIWAVLLLPLGPGALAQGMKWRGSGGWGPGTAYGRMYDPKTVETVTGEVVKVDRITPTQ